MLFRRMFTPHDDQFFPPHCKTRKERRQDQTGTTSPLHSPHHPTATPATPQAPRASLSLSRTLASAHGTPATATFTPPAGITPATATATAPEAAADAGLMQLSKAVESQ